MFNSSKNNKEYNENRIKNRYMSLSSPPRAVPVRLTSGILCGGPLGSFGALFGAFGMIFVFVFISSSRLIPSLKVLYANETAIGNIIKIEDTNATSNNEPVYKLFFSFIAENGKTYSQYSYVSGGLYDANNKLVNKGDNVKIKYVRTSPNYSIIDAPGARFSTFGVFVLFVFVFPLIGIIMSLINLIKGIKQIKLLKFGKIADGKIISSSPTNTTVNNLPVMKYRYSYIDENETEHEDESKTLLTDKIGDEIYEPVLYYKKGSYNVSELVDALPKRIDIDLNGNFISNRKDRFLGSILLQFLLWAQVILFICISLNQI
jgi:hypothetical protein